ncbi:hypothetical protein [Nocardiopsis potens]|uniref:hypothetical protein n=1 Tax=Nocardiopsis potens TaxID=1246458 RepID=UPI000346E572|nr:hypothetical protein [Nocardiopsis potens]
MIGTAGGIALADGAPEATGAEAAGTDGGPGPGGRGRGLLSPGRLWAARALLVAAAAVGWAAAGDAAPSEERIAVKVTARTNGATGTVIEGYRAEDGGITLVYAARGCTAIGPVRAAEDSSTVQVSATEVYTEAQLADCTGAAGGSGGAEGAGGAAPASGGTAGRAGGHAELESPLGSRDVVDAAGRPVPECTSLTCAAD